MDNADPLHQLLQEPALKYIPDNQLPLFSEKQLLKGEFLKIDPSEKEASDPQLLYQNPNGKMFVGDSLRWLSLLENESVDLIIADPPYNIKKAEWDTFESQQVYVQWSLKWVEQAARVLKPSGTLYICGFSEILADIKLPASRFFKGCRWLVWHYKNKANLRFDWGRSHESILHFRKSKEFTFNTDNVRIPYGNHTTKYPERTQAETSQYGRSNKGKKHIWRPHPGGAKPRDVIEIPTTCNGMHETTPHPTQKPEELFRKLVLASSNEGDLIIDPFLGSGTTAVVAEQLKRYWMGCDMSEEYSQWAIERIELVKEWPIEKWIEHDLNNAKRRESIR
ncbi:MAG: site-specific DNA-methyltransferase [Chloroflexi bacterium]|nr:site-specific DNA-methyltransferase [Chloroflexota bacterium]